MRYNADMQINRLFEMIYILLDKKTVTAKELAERFEVSTRTIYRDVETLSSAGVPIYMQKGKGGGVGLLPEFVLNKAILSEEEKSEVLSALQSFHAADPNSSAALSKLSNLFGTSSANWVEIDYSDWDPGKQAQFELIKQAVLSRRVINFDYFNTSGESSRREAEPITLWFKSRAWYLKAFCVKKQDFRLFKLVRMKNIVLTDRAFEAKSVPVFDYPEAPPPPVMPEIKIKFDASLNYKVYDDFADDSISENPDGSFTVSFCASVDSWFYGYVMSFGAFVEVLQPEYAREAIKDMLRKSLEKYCKHSI